MRQPLLSPGQAKILRRIVDASKIFWQRAEGSEFKSYDVALGQKQTKTFMKK